MIEFIVSNDKGILYLLWKRNSYFFEAFIRRVEFKGIIIGEDYYGFLRDFYRKINKEWILI